METFGGDGCQNIAQNKNSRDNEFLYIMTSFGNIARVMIFRYMRIYSRYFFILLVIVFLASCENSEPATTVIFGGTIYTMNSQQPVVEAVAIRNNRILLAGPKVEVFRLMDDKTEMIDLHGKTVVPGFIEGHGHIMDVGINEMSLNLAGLAASILQALPPSTRLFRKLRMR
jgi:hypothetical protein